MAPSSPTEYESRSDSSDDDPALVGLDADVSGETDSTHASGLNRPHPRPRLDTSHTGGRDKSRSPMSPGTRAWYEFDLAVVVALVSPLGHLLTGGDHIKNLLLIVLLIFYLHQIIEVPWSLYHKARPRKRTPRSPNSPATVEEHYRHLAVSELKNMEIFFLSLTALSPCLGAALLRYVTAAVIGPDAVSWFSTGLFVLATGMRPWSHIVQRLTQRANDLHDVIHYPSPDSAANDLSQQLDDLLKRVASLENSLQKAKAKIASNTDEVFEYVDEAMDAVERAVQRHEKRFEKQEVKVKDIEKTLNSAKSKEKSPRLTVDTLSSRPSLSIFQSFFPQWLVSPPHRNLYDPVYSPSSAASKLSLRSFPPSPVARLETIPEEAASNFTPTAISVTAMASGLTSGLVYRAGYLVTLPLRAVVRMILQKY
ncbi:hypothetical protein BD779DRAFT_1612123 [Infundibulicybe gibba]|nr:hypothetical protein BD779DRAFT_1612123 [Infundibulicybe gibba]